MISFILSELFSGSIEYGAYVLKFLVLMACALNPPLNPMMTYPVSEALGLNFGLSLHLHSNFLLDNVTSTKISCADSYVVILQKRTVKDNE